MMSEKFLLGFLMCCCTERLQVNDDSQQNLPEQRMEVGLRQGSLQIQQLHLKICLLSTGRRQKGQMWWCLKFFAQ